MQESYQNLINSFGMILAYGLSPARIVPNQNGLSPARIVPNLANKMPHFIAK